jgi:hypothetical protein
MGVLDQITKNFQVDSKCFLGKPKKIGHQLWWSKVGDQELWWLNSFLVINIWWINLFTIAMHNEGSLSVLEIFLVSILTNVTDMLGWMPTWRPTQIGCVMSVLTTLDNIGLKFKSFVVVILILSPMIRLCLTYFCVLLMLLFLTSCLCYK